MKTLILTVDDDIFIRKLVGAFLRERGCEVLEAEDGVQALRLVEKRRPDLIIMDVLMSEMHGTTAARSLQSSAATSDIPILVYSAAHEQDVLADLPRGPRVRFMRKPADLPELWARIQEMLGAR